MTGPGNAERWVAPDTGTWGDMTGTAQAAISAELVIRPLRPEDEGSVRALHERLTERDTYLRFFTLSPANLDELADTLCRQDETHVGLGAFDDGTIVGVASYSVIEADGQGPIAECAVAVSHPLQHHGIGTALSQRLVDVARRRHIRRLSAFVLAENTTMLQVLSELGWSRNPLSQGPVVEVSVDLAEPGTGYDA